MFWELRHSLATPYVWVVSALVLLAALSASLHAILTKRDYRAALNWVAVIWLAPMIGPVLYVLLGVNRIERRALRRFSPARKQEGAGHARDPHLEHAVMPEEMRAEPLQKLIVFGDRVSHQPLTHGNRVEMLHGVEAAFDAMLEAIDSARHSVGVLTYIFDVDAVGRRFIDALQRARERGVEVRVLADYVGSRDSRPDTLRSLHKAGLTAAYFLPVYWPLAIHHFNLRNHRKLLIIDGRLGFTGGTNITTDHTGNRRYPRGARDTHFRIEGPVVRHMQEAFATDWYFSAEGVLEGEHWFPPTEERGSTWARGIAHGPDEGFDRLRMTLLGAVSAAQESIRVMTPYFLPDATLIDALKMAALRGIEVDVVTPARSDHRIIDWASRSVMLQVAESGCRVWHSPPPFDHSKLCVVDRHWSLIGSTNWDPRSLRLNFEFNLECYCRELGAALAARIDTRRREAERITVEQLRERSLPTRIRDGICRLGTPYL